MTEKRKKDYTFRRQFNEKPSIIPGCPGALHDTFMICFHALLGLQRLAASRNTV